jgi:ATP/maltotriose-dependent transcriptional regulator MalT
VVDANATAQELLGPCVGRACHDLVRGRDHRGKLVCSRQCTSELVATGEGRTTIGTAGRASARRILCVPLGEHAVVRLEPAPEEVPEESLTRRELEVLTLVADGHTTDGVAALLGISFATARTHMEHIRAKLSASSRAEAVARAKALGWLP